MTIYNPNGSAALISQRDLVPRHGFFPSLVSKMQTNSEAIGEQLLNAAKNALSALTPIRKESEKLLSELKNTLDNTEQFSHPTFGDFHSKLDKLKQLSAKREEVAYDLSCILNTILISQKRSGSRIIPDDNSGLLNFKKEELEFKRSVIGLYLAAAKKLKAQPAVDSSRIKNIFHDMDVIMKNPALSADELDGKEVNELYSLLMQRELYAILNSTITKNPEPCHGYARLLEDSVH